MRTNEQLLDDLTAQHERYLLANPTGEIAQTVLIERGDGDCELALCGWGNELERNLILDWLQNRVIETKARRYAFWAEAWFKTVAVKSADEAREEAKKYQHGDIAKDPERREVVFTVVVESNGRTHQRMQTIERGPDGDVVALVLSPPNDMTGLGGALANLFPPPKVVN
jgi:hypothetical protein